MAQHSSMPRQEEEPGTGFPIQLKILLGIIVVGLFWVLIKGSGIV
jgi:hypothetical protein